MPRMKFKVSQKAILSTARTEIMNLQEQLAQLNKQIAAQSTDELIAQEALNKVYKEKQNDRRK